MSVICLNDQYQREQATDPAHSYIVQAPAGSGKTEMLSQRFLRLLAIVQAPEQIVALTFTRKAAAEMRERIINSLQRAARNESSDSPHQQQTLEWAHTALNHSNRLQWDLLNQPHRLRIMTIDALCQQISRAIPIQEQAIPFASINENANLTYQQAARSCIRFALENEDTRASIIRILAHLDNNQGKLIELFCQLLANREQWLPVVLSASSRSRIEFENDLHQISEHEVARFKAFFPKDLQQQFLSIVRMVAEHSDFKEGYFSCLKTCYDFDTLTHQQLQALIEIILTKDGKFRAKYDHYIGIQKGLIDDATFDLIKLESTSIQNHLKEIHGLQDHLIRLRTLPESTYQDEQWNVLQSLLELLPQLAAHLQLLFSEQGQVDFASIAQQANYALGTDEQPTDLALFFDNSICHLLIDEFQDTSLSQYELIRKLMMGWEKNDGRTLFLVGDPMQSIYRFRQAEVGLFLKAREQGIGPVSLIPLELSTNFRSSETIVHWVNQQFKNIFPAQDDIEAGAITYHHSDAVHAAHEKSFIKATSYVDSDMEAQGIIDIIRHELQSVPEQKIAILVRSRTNLLDIMNRLRQENIPFQGVDIDLLGSLPHIQDIWSLTRALLFPANRLAWLSLLRSPFCGLSLQDIHQLVKDKRTVSFLEIIEQLTPDNQPISVEGWQRLTTFMNIMRTAIAQRHHYRLVEHLVLILQRLGADTLYDAQQHNDIEQFWQLLEKFEQDGLLSDIRQINEGLQNLYAQQSNSASLQVMTIHKSKGLEFDTVILPHLGAKKKPADKPLIRWLKLPQKNSRSLFLLAPLKAEHETQSSLYNFLQMLDKEKEDYESQRLLYVAVTRARHRLYLCSHKTKPEKGSLQFLLPDIHFEEQMPLNQSETSETKLPILQRLPLSCFQPQLSMESDAHNRMLHTSSYNQSTITGSLCHSLLQWISEHQIFHIDSLPWSRIHNDLRMMGLPDTEQEGIVKNLKHLLENMFNDETGRWILSAHPIALNETSFMENRASDIQIKIPDRFFRDEQGQLWVVDFKTGHKNSATEEKYNHQVSDYARILHHLYPGDAIHCGIYYLENQYWHCWPYIPGDLNEHK